MRFLAIALLLGVRAFGAETQAQCEARLRPETLQVCSGDHLSVEACSESLENNMHLCKAASKAWRAYEKQVKGCEWKASSGECSPQSLDKLKSAAQHVIYVEDVK